MLADIGGTAQLGLTIAALGLHLGGAASQFLARAMKHAVTTKNRVWMIACLPVAGWLMAGRGQPEPAVELLALGLTHPLHASGWMEKWPVLHRLRANLDNTLGTEKYEQAWARGKTLNLEHVLTALAAELENIEADA